MLTYLLLTAGSICWGVFWTPRNPDLAGLLGFWILMCIGACCFEWSRRCMIVNREDYDERGNRRRPPIR